MLRQAIPLWSPYGVDDDHVCAQGSSTACILALEGATLHAANLGDSGFMVVRRNKVAFKSRSQQHQFNYPFQLGRGGRFPFDSPAAAEVRYSAPYPLVYFAGHVTSLGMRRRT